MITIAKRIAWKVVAPPFRALVRHFGVTDPWEPVNASVPAHRFGTGSRHRFGWYLDGESDVDVETVGEICAWLYDCEYRSDMDLFGEPDFWQHPRTFESLRAGDCEDFALWAWRKLLRIGDYRARFFIGRVVGEGSHAWVVFDRDGSRWVLEGAAKTRPQLRPLAAVREEYEPWLSVGPDLRTTAHQGYMLRMSRKSGEATDSGPAELCLASI